MLVAFIILPELLHGYLHMHMVTLPKGGECKMKFGILARQARLDISMPSKEAAVRLHITRQTLSNMESGETEPDPQNVINMVKLYNEPSLLNAHCRLNCPIGSKLNYMLPNRMPRNMTVITVRNMKESEEHINCLKNFAYGSVSGKERPLLKKEAKEILQAEYWIETWKEQIIREYGLDELESLIREVNCDYIDEGLVCT